MPEIQRHTAFYLSIKRIHEARYVKKEGWEPSYLKIGDTTIKRVNIAGIIIDKSTQQYTIEDKTGKIRLLMFNDQKHHNIEPGNLVRVIGKPRKKDDETFIVPEIMKEIENKAWLAYRQKLLNTLEYMNTEIKREEPKLDKDQPVDHSSKILDKVKELDDGDGARFEEVKQALDGDDIEDEINKLINEGELFEIQPGMLKLLD